MFNEKNVSIAEEIFLVTKCPKPIKYLYPLDKGSHAVIMISEGNTICAILRLWYGIRCISAHGMAAQAFSKDGALYKFPYCEKCRKDTPSEEIQLLCKGWSLCEEIKTFYASDLPKSLESRVSDQSCAVIASIPDIKTIQSRGNDQARNLIKDLGLKQGICSSGNVYYHISRIAFFASNLEKRVYITYRLLVRINQFVLLLAFRIKPAFAKYLVKYSRKKNGNIVDLKKGLWGYVVSDDEKDGNERVRKLIEEVQGKHKEKIEEIQKSTEHHFYTGTCYF